MPALRVDAHQHFWRYINQDLDWMTEAHEPLKRDFLPLNLEPLLVACGVDVTVAVQARQVPAETDFLLELAESTPMIAGVVGWIDLIADDIHQNLDAFADEHRLCGFRHIVEDEPDPDFMLEPAFLKGLAALDEFGFTYDLLVKPHQLPAAIEVAGKFPNLSLVLDHIAKPDIRDSHMLPWATHIAELAAHENVWCKASGLVTEASWTDWQGQDFTPWLDHIFECFGSDRIMFGSDWPVCTLAASYQQVYGIVESYVAQLSEHEQERVWGQNALDFYGIEHEDIATDFPAL